jgi:uncharacterized protein involved in exopolysaccharide biosynthesis
MATLQTLPDATTFLPQPVRPGLTTLAARSFFYAVFKHGRLVVGTFLLIFLAAAVSAIMRPNSWRAKTKVLAKLGETVQLAPAETPSRSVTLPLTPEVVKTEAEIVKSSEVVRRAVERVGVTPAPGVSLDEVISKVQQSLSVTPLPGSNVLEISYVGRSPERAANMVNAITDVYLDHHNRVYRNEGLGTFYGEQLTRLRNQMKDAQRRLRDYLRRERIVDIDQEITIFNQDVLDQEKGFRTFRSKLAGTERRLERIRRQIDEMPVQIPFTADYNLNPAAETIKKKLIELELEHSQLLQYYQPVDRRVRDKEEEIARLKTRLSGESARILSSETVRTNELRNERERTALALDVQLTDLRAREPGLRTRLKSSRRRLRELRDKRFTIHNLKQDVEQRSYAFDLYRKRREEARIQEAMTNQSMVNVAVVEHAARPLEPENGLLMPLVIGLLGGLGVAAGMAVAVEYVNRTLRFEEEVERYLELPVLAVIPDLESTSSIARG